MSNFFSSFEGILTMSVITIVFILAMMVYMGWKFFKLSASKPQPGEKTW